MGDSLVGRRSMPPLDCGSLSAGTEPRRERPHLPPRSVTPMAAPGVVHVSVPHVGVRVSMWGGSASDRGPSRALSARTLSTVLRSQNVTCTKPTLDGFVL